MQRPAQAVPRAALHVEHRLPVEVQLLPRLLVPLLALPALPVVVVAAAQQRVAPADQREVVAQDQVLSQRPLLRVRAHPPLEPLRRVGGEQRLRRRHDLMFFDHAVGDSASQLLNAPLIESPGRCIQLLATFATELPSSKTFPNPCNTSHYVALTKAEMAHLRSLPTLRNIELP